MDTDEYEISTDPSRIDVDLVHDFLAQSYWAQGRTLELVKKSIEHSLCFGVYQDSQQVAFARVTTDRAVFAYLADVFVVPSHRGLGIFKLLMRTILGHADVKDIKMFLLGTRDAHELYDQFGFVRYQSERTMVKYNKDGDRRVI